MNQTTLLIMTKQNAKDVVTGQQQNDSMDRHPS